MFVIEFGPIGVFFIVYHFSDFMWAALSLGVSTLIALILSQVINKRIPWFAIFSGSITIFTALLTFLFTAPWILIAQDSVYYFLFALLLGVSMWKNLGLFRSFFGHIFAIAFEGWNVLEQRWFVFFILAGLSNEFVRVFLSTDEWVTYKQVIVLLFLIFGLYQFRISSKYRLEEADRLGLRKHTSVTTI
ncbi:MAG: intracellular septation protein [Candidatus Azotimanducaceae bacterium]|jgi:intracellular septation protein